MKKNALQPAASSFFATLAMSQGARNWPFFTLTTRPVAPAATIKSVCRQRKAGIWSTSTVSLAISASWGEWTSVVTGIPNSPPISPSRRQPSRTPVPRKDRSEVRLALSYDALKTKAAPSPSQMAFSFFAILRVNAADSITHGPRMNNSSRPPSLWEPILTIGLRGISSTLSAPVPIPQAFAPANGFDPGCFPA